MKPSLHALRGETRSLEAPNPTGVAEAQLNSFGLRGDQFGVLSSFALGSEPNLYFVTDLLYPAVNFSYLLWGQGRLRKYSAGQPEN